MSDVQSNLFLVHKMVLQLSTSANTMLWRDKTLKKAQTSRVENQVYSNRVLRSEFDKNWKTFISNSGYVIYVATRNNAKVTVLLSGGSTKLLIFKRGGRILVGSGGVSHYSKPHIAKTL